MLIPLPNSQYLEPNPVTDIDKATQIELEAAAFRRLLDHLRHRPDVQNIDLMTMAGFCRNCLANWYTDAAKTAGLAVTKDEARTMVYGMSYEDWKAKHQPDATPTQATAFANKAHDGH